MRILVCVQEYYPSGSGIANVAYYVVKELEKLGHTCNVVSSGGDADVILGAFSVNNLAGFGLFHFWELVRKYISKNEEEYDLVWIHNPLFLRKINSSKLFATVHTTYVKYFDLYSKLNYSFFVKFYYYFMTRLEKLCYNKNQFKISSVVSSEVKKELLNLDVSKEITYVQNGVDTIKFKILKNPVNSFNLPSNKNFFLCVGRVSYQKNPFGTIDFMASLHKKDNTIHFCWAGDGELLEDVKSYVQEKNYSFVQMLGKVPHENLVDLYSLADVYVLLSFYEGQPLTLLEALSCGLVPLVSNIPNLKEVVDSIGFGICVDYKNNSEPSRVISYLKKNQSKKIKTEIRNATIKLYDWKLVTKKYISEFKKLLL